MQNFLQFQQEKYNLEVHNYFQSSTLHKLTHLIASYSLKVVPYIIRLEKCRSVFGKHLTRWNFQLNNLEWEVSHTSVGRFAQNNMNHSYPKGSWVPSPVDLKLHPWFTRWKVLLCTNNNVFPFTKHKHT